MGLRLELAWLDRESVRLSCGEFISRLWAQPGLPLAPRLFSFPFFSTTPSLFLSIFPGKLRGNRQIFGSEPGWPNRQNAGNFAGEPVYRDTFGGTLGGEFVAAPQRARRRACSVWSVGRTPWVPGSAADTRAVLPGSARRLWGCNKLETRFFGHFRRFWPISLHGTARYTRSIVRELTWRWPSTRAATAPSPADAGCSHASLRRLHAPTLCRLMPSWRPVSIRRRQSRRTSKLSVNKKSPVASSTPGNRGRSKAAPPGVGLL